MRQTACLVVTRIKIGSYGSGSGSAVRGQLLHKAGSAVRGRPL